MTRQIGVCLRLSLSFLVVIALTSCCSLGRLSSLEPPQVPALRLTSDSTPKGIFVVVHGLNQQPETMDPIETHLSSLGYHTYRVVLRGHERAEDAAFPAAEWERNLREAFAFVHTRYPNLPSHLLAYSLGGLLAVKVLDGPMERTPTSVILLAPALSLRLLPQSGYMLSILPALTVSVPNIAPRYYRRYARTPLFWYQNTFQVYSETRSLTTPSRLAAIPTLVVANPRDEIVSFTGLKSWIEDNGLDRSWNFQVVRPQSHDPRMPEHVIIDPISLGVPEWKNMKGIIREFLQSQALHKSYTP